MAEENNVYKVIDGAPLVDPYGDISDSDGAFSDVGEPDENTLKSDHDVETPQSIPDSSDSDSEGDPGSVPDPDPDPEPGSPDSVPNVEPDEFSTPNAPLSSCGNIESTGESVQAPKVGERYGSDQDIEKHYLAYAKQQGFGITRAAAGRNVKLEIRNVTWRCECAGWPDTRRNRKIQAICTDDDAPPKIIRTRNSKPSKKVGCKATVYASKDKDGSWVVGKVVLDHIGHFPTPQVSKHIYQHRKSSFNGSAKCKLFNHIDSGLSVPQAADAMAHERHGYENVDLTERDMRNEVAKQRRLKLKDGDANAMMDYFDTMYANNQSFYYKFRWDKQGVVKDVLWVDARSRAAYEEFGDVVCFDTTYLTNKYDLPFANFIGVNHHGQSILLGCALVSNENCETFEWVFKTGLACMNGKAPDCILTDQAAAFVRPLKNVMPNTRHRWCLWHIMQKFSKKLCKFGNYDELKNVLKDIIYESLSEKEFDERWTAAVDEFQLGGCKWLSKLYEKKAMWVPAYQNDKFWAGMKSTQRVESIHSFFDKYLKKHTRLSEFVQDYCKALEKRTLREVKADYHCRRYVRQLRTDWMVERVFQKVYTDAKFALVQEECDGVMYCNGREERVLSEHLVEHVIEDRVKSPISVKNPTTLKPITQKPTKKRLYRVKFDTISHDVFCECKSFETKGIMCRHSIRVYDLHDVTFVPEKYILRRWRKDVKRKHSRVKVAYHDPLKTADVRRYDNMMVAFENVAVTAMDNERANVMVMELIADIETRVKELVLAVVPSPSVHPSVSERLTVGSESQGASESTGVPLVDIEGDPLFAEEVGTQESFNGEVGEVDGRTEGNQQHCNVVGEGEGGSEGHVGEGEGGSEGHVPKNLGDPPRKPTPIFTGKRAKSGRILSEFERNWGKKIFPQLIKERQSMQRP